jgi:hypothetical protein
MLSIKLAKPLSVHVKADMSLTDVVRENTVLGSSLGMNKQLAVRSCIVRVAMICTVLRTVCLWGR